jgi:GDP-4-dehydro-6-deoxy-D-mannose reductase
MATAPRRILVTGAAGFVGRHLTAALPSAFPEARLFIREFDITDPTAVDSAIVEIMPDVCLHLAAISTNALAIPDETHTWAVNLHGTLHLARAILQHAPDCQLLFVSSADAYGASFRSGSKLDESAALAPMNLYAATKAAADLALGAMVEQGLRVIRLRPSNHTGAGQSSGLVVAAFARQVARIEAGLQPPVIEVGNLEPRRDFLDVRDVCQAYIACVARRDGIAQGAIFNVASGEARRVGDVLDALIAAAGIAVEIRVDPRRTRSTDVKLAWCDATRARQALGWAPSTPWQQTLQDVLGDWRHRIATDPTIP